MAVLQIWKDGHCTPLSFEAPAPLWELLERAGAYARRPCGGRGLCGKCAVTVTGAVSRRNAAETAAGTRLACQAEILGDAQVFLPAPAQEQIQTDTGKIPLGRPMEGRIGAAVDIGTTTVVLRRYDLTTGQLLGQAAMVDPQIATAADVMGRIDAAVHGKLDALSAQIREAVTALLLQAGGPADTAVITGNTTMLYLLTGRDPSPLAKAPFEADTLFDTLWEGAYLPPCLHAFVGADITCAVLDSGMCERAETALLCDLGTNGELALWKDGTLFVTSTAAGPAFEGAGISCGCSSIAGAIDRVWVEDGALRIHTIGEQPPVGLCGSGLIDAVAALLQTERLDETGALEDGDVVLAPGVCLQQKDIRAVQLAKAAIAAGIAVLLETSHTDCAEIGTFYLAGGFGSRMDASNGARIGLFPGELTDKICVLGNGALAGAARMLLDRESVSSARDIASRSRHVTLSGSRSFQEHYMEQLLFPEP